MPLWGANGAAVSNTPKFTVLVNHVSNSSVNTTANLYVNTTPSAFINNTVVGIYGVTPTELAVAEAANVKNVSSPGWVLRKSGMGPVINITMSNTGTGYSNLDVVHIKGSAGCVNSSAVVTTNSTGGIISLTGFSNNGGLFPNVAYAAVTISNTTGGAANGSNFAATAVLGGRAGRVQNEVLVSYGSMTGNSSQNTAAFPNHS